MSKQKIKSILKQNMALTQKLAEDKPVATIEKIARLAIDCLKAGGKIMLFGNGGSAADAQHICAELVGRFTKQRKALAAIALTCNSSNLTSIGNDYDFSQVFVRQIEALGKKQDLAIAISTSGSSANILAAVAQAKEQGIKTAALTSEQGSKLAQTVDAAVCVPVGETARIQEAHITIGHILCELIEQDFL